MNIVVLFGGLSTEREVSLTGGKAVIEALRSKGHNVTGVDPIFGRDFTKSEKQFVDDSLKLSSEDVAKTPHSNYLDCVNSPAFDNIDVVFILLHGKYGEDGIIQSILEMKGIPYTGSKTLASAIAMDKEKSKIVFQSHNISVPDGMVVSKEYATDFTLLKQIREHYGNKLVLKPNDQGSTIGITITDSGVVDDIANGILLAAQYSDKVILEQFIEGRELTVGIVGNSILPVIEIIPEDGFYDYEHKYTKGKTEYVCPAELPDDILEFTQSMAEAAYNSLGCEGFARVDFRLNDDGQPVVLEVNTVPGFTETSLVPMAAAQLGVSFADLCDKIIEITLQNK